MQHVRRRPHPPHRRHLPRLPRRKRHQRRRQPHHRSQNRLPLRLPLQPSHLLRLRALHQPLARPVPPGDVPVRRAAHRRTRIRRTGSSRLLRTFATRDYLPPDPVTRPPDIQSSIAIGADGTIYNANFPAVLFALRDSGSGDQLQLVWRFHPAGACSFHATPAIGRDGTVYLVLPRRGTPWPERCTHCQHHPPELRHR